MKHEENLKKCIIFFQKFKHPINIKNYVAHPHDMVHVHATFDMVHVHATFRGNTAMCPRITVRKRNGTP